MRNSLSKLLCDDLAELARHESDYIASEEAMRVMSALYNEDKGLNIRIIHKEQLSNFLESVSIMTTPGHYQFIVEVGERSKLKQRDPDTIHYCAVDLFIRPDNAPLVFVCDHYRGHDAYYSEFEAIAKKFNAQFVIVGGSIYQADNVHCPIFSLQHLLLTAKDEHILPKLEEVISQSMAQVTKIQWDQLSPMYMVYSQSVSTLFHYVSEVKKREGTAAELDSALISNSQFVQHLQETLYPMVQEGKDQGKIRNKAIKYLAAYHAGQAVVALEQIPGLDTDALISICYQERYPMVYEALFIALQVEKAYPFATDSALENSHPLFELAFYNAHILEGLFINEDFRAIFTNKNLLILMQKGLINPTALFHALTEQMHHLELNKSTCRNTASNLMLLAAIVENELDSKLDISSEALIQLLTSGKTKSFFQDETLSVLFEKGLISLDLLQLISPWQVNIELLKTLESDEDKIGSLRNQFIPTVIPPIEQSDNSDGSDDYMAFFGDDDDLFEVPEVEPSTLTPELAKKPQINVDLLVKSMEKSVFTTPQTESTDNHLESDTVQKILVSSS